MKVPLLEVICVAYQRYGPLKVFVQSWLNQTADNWRLKVIHDGPDPEFDRIMREFASAVPGRVSFENTQARINDYGHSLRAVGLSQATGDYVLLTNGDNYYVPRCLEYLTEAMRETRADVILYDMVHSHNTPGGRPLPSYAYFQTDYSRYNIDMGAAIVRTEWARAAGFRDLTHDGDQTYFEDVARAAGEHFRTHKIERVLFVHN